MTSQEEGAELASHEGLVRRICAKYTYREDYEDICQIGRIGLLKALREFDPLKGRISTLAAIYIRREVFNHFRYEHYKAHECPGIETSLDLPYGESDLLIDTIEDGRLASYEQACLEARLELEGYLACLDDRSRHILWLQARGYNNREIGDAMRVSKQRIHQVAKESVKKVQLAIALHGQV